MQKSFSQKDTASYQNKIFQRNNQSIKTASQIVSELKQLDSLKVYCQIQSDIIAYQDSIITAKDSVAVIRASSDSLQTEAIRGYVIELSLLKSENADLKSQIQTLKARKPKRLIWFFGGFLFGFGLSKL